MCKRRLGRCASSTGRVHPGVRLDPGAARRQGNSVFEGLRASSRPNHPNPVLPLTVSRALLTSLTGATGFGALFHVPIQADGFLNPPANITTLEIPVAGSRFIIPSCKSPTYPALRPLSAPPSLISAPLLVVRYSPLGLGSIHHPPAAPQRPLLLPINSGTHTPRVSFQVDYPSLAFPLLFSAALHPAHRHILHPASPNNSQSPAPPRALRRFLRTRHPTNPHHHLASRHPHGSLQPVPSSP